MYFCRHVATSHYISLHAPRSEEVVIGQHHYRNKTLVLCGLMRNCGRNVTLVRQQIERIKTLFARVHIIIVENDSTDDTRKQLLQWVADRPDDVTILGCGINNEECKLNLCDTSTLDGIGKVRISKMVYLRNLYMAHIENTPELRDADYCGIMDMDLVGNFCINGLAHTGYVFQNNTDVDAVATNGWGKNGLGYMYYDFYCFRTASLWPFKKIHFFNIFVSNNFSEPAYKVESAFGGFAIYKMKALHGKRYHLVKNIYGYVCEHTTLHETMNMYLDPQFLYAIDENMCQNGYY
jgi:hypothetical protein